MNQNIFKRNELLAKRVIAGLKSRNMNGYYCADRASALAQALALIFHSERQSGRLHERG